MASSRVAKSVNGHIDHTTDQRSSWLCVGRMQCAPTFGAVPSAADVKKKQEEAAMVEEKRDEVLMQLMNKEVAMRLNAMEVDNPAKVVN